MRTRIFQIVATLVVAAQVAFASSPAPLQLSKQIPERLQKFVEDKTVPGAVGLVANHEAVLSLNAVGESDLAGHRAMKDDDLFWIASMTKPITAVAIMMLQDEGKLSVEDPVEKYLPEFKGQMLVDNRTSNSLTLVKPARPITVRDLLTHTSGLGDVPAPRGDCSLAELVMAYSQKPLQFAPGSKWSYSNSGINTLGRIVEVVSGTPYAEFLEKRILKPLGMRDTTFWPSSSQLKRLAKSYKPAKEGKGLEETDIFFMKGDISSQSRTAYPSGGLFSTARDYAKFLQMMLNKGELGGKRILSQEAVAAMTRTQTDKIKTGFTDGMSWGLGFAVVKEPTGVTATLSPGTFGHGGAYGTQAWADPKKDRALVLMIQRAGLPNADASDIRRAFQEVALGQSGLGGASGPYFFIQLSDPQFGMFTGNKDFSQETANFEFAVANINRLKPAFVVNTGDLVNKPGDAAQIAEFHRISGKIDSSIPVYNVVGNHDVENVPTPETIAAYTNGFGPDNYTFRHGSFVGIILNSCVIHSPQNTSNELARIEKWLRGELQRAKADKAQHIVIFQHHPWFLKAADEQDQYFNIPKERREAFLKMFHDYGVKYCFSGHYHRNAVAKDGELEAVTTGPVGMPQGGDKSGMRVVTVRGDKIEHRYYTFGEIPNRIDLREQVAKAKTK